MDVDPNDQTKHPTLDDFKAKYGTTVNYTEVDRRQRRVRRDDPPALQARPGHRLGHRHADRLDGGPADPARLGRAFDLANMPNVVANLQDVYKNVSWDPTNDHHVPWQSGMTGLGYDTAKTGDLTSLDALYTDDPSYEGQGRRT